MLTITSWLVVGLGTCIFNCEAIFSSAEWDNGIRDIIGLLQELNE